MSTVALVATCWSLVAGGFSLVAWVKLQRRRVAPPPPSRWPSVLLLRPVDEPSALEQQNLAAPIDYSGPLQHVLVSPRRVVETPSLTWVQSSPTTPNRKVGHLLNALVQLPPPPKEERVVVSIDADVRVDRALLEALVSSVQHGAALASAPPLPTNASTFATRLSRGVLVASHHNFVALGVMSAGAPTVCGKAVALGPLAVSLLPLVANCIGEDLELAIKLHEAGAKVELCSAPAAVPSDPALTVRQVFHRFSRWMSVLRAHRPALLPTVPLLIAATPLALALSLVQPERDVALAALFLLSARTLLSLALEARAGPRAGAWWQWFAAEVLLDVAVLRAVSSRTVTWRGRRFVVSRGGAMEPILQ